MAELLLNILGVIGVVGLAIIYLTAAFWSLVTVISHRLHAYEAKKWYRERDKRLNMPK